MHKKMRTSKTDTHKQNEKKTNNCIELNRQHNYVFTVDRTGQNWVVSACVSYIRELEGLGYWISEGHIEIYIPVLHMHIYIYIYIICIKNVCI